MSLSNLLDNLSPYDLFCNSLTAYDNLKTSTLDTTDPDFLLIGSNQFTTQGVIFGATGSAQTYMFNGVPFNPAGNTGPTGPSNGITGAAGATGATGPAGIASIGTPAVATNNNGLTLTGSILNAQLATTARPGILSAGAQTISGNKTFDSPLSATQLTSTSNIIANYVSLPTTASSTVGVINVNSNRMLHSYGNDNLFLGNGAGNFTLTGTANVGVGSSNGRVLTNGNLNIMIGQSSGFAVTSGTGNVLVGSNSGLSLATADNCIAIGTNVLANNVSGDNIIEISDGTIGNSIAGDIRIGFNTSTACYLRGVAGVSPGGTPEMVVINPSTHLFGSQSIDNALTTSFTPTLNSGTILTSSVRGSLSSSLPINLTKRGSAVTMVIPAFVLLTQGGSAGTIIYTGATNIAATYRPTYALSFPVIVKNNAILENGVIYVSPVGAVSMQLLSGAQFVPQTGSDYDLSVSWNIVP